MGPVAAAAAAASVPAAAVAASVPAEALAAVAFVAAAGMAAGSEVEVEVDLGEPDALRPSRVGAELHF